MKLEINTEWNDKIVVLKKATLQFYFKFSISIGGSIAMAAIRLALVLLVMFSMYDQRK